MTAPDDPRPGGLLDLALLPDAPPMGDAPTDRPGLGRAIGAFLGWGLVGQMIPFIPAALSVETNTYRPLLPPAVGLVYALAFAAAFVWWYVVRGGPHAAYRRETFRLRPIPGAVAARLPFVGVPLVVMVVASLVLVPRVIPPPPDHSTILDRYARLPLGGLVVLALAAVIAPLLEEFLFRGWIQRRLERRLAPMAAVLLTATIFAAVHGELFGFPSRLLFGAVAGYVAWSTRSIWPGVVLHGFYNASLIVGSAGSGRELSSTDLTRWSRTPGVFWPALLAFGFAAVLLIVGLRMVAQAAAAARGSDDVVPPATDPLPTAPTA